MCPNGSDLHTKLCYFGQGLRNVLFPRSGTISWNALPILITAFCLALILITPNPNPFSLLLFFLSFYTLPVFSLFFHNILHFSLCPTMSSPVSDSAALRSDSSAIVLASSAAAPLSLSLSPALSPEEFELLWLQRQRLHAEKGNEMEEEAYVVSNGHISPRFFACIISQKCAGLPNKSVMYM